MEQKVFQKLQELEERVREASREFYHSRPLASYTVTDASGKTQEVKLDSRDVILASAISSNNVLITGSTGCGKTHLAKMMMTALFGEEGYRVLQMDASFSMDKLRDIAFKTIAEGGDLREAVKGTPILNSPGVIIDEYNRAPAEITNIIQGWLQNGTLTFEGGKEVKPGIPFDGELYQWKIATVNEGTRYSGARRLDKASRDRLAVEIPIDLFPLTDDDKRKLRKKKGTGIEVYNGTGVLKDFLEVLKYVREVPLSGPADEFIGYMQRMNQCIKAPNKTKLEIENFSPEYCKGCRLSKGDNNLCGSVNAPSDRSVINWSNLAKAFAVLRSLKTPEEAPTADIEDCIASAPFALLSKLDIHQGWIDAVGKGSKWQAINNVIRRAYERFQKSVRVNYEYISTPTPENVEAIGKYAEENDCWSADIREGL